MKKRLPFFLGLLVVVSYLISRLATNSFNQKETIPVQPTLSPTVASSQTTSSDSISTTPLPNLVKVKRVIDGDTIELESGQKLRYIGINTPETVDPRRAPQCFGKEASNKNRDLVEGKMVRLEKDVSETDKFGRLLRYVYLENGTMVNQFLVREGFARASSYPPDIKYQDLFREAEKLARQENKGLWAGCNSSANQVTHSGCNIKGNLASSGEKIYHVPGQKYYDQTVIDETKGEKWFCSTSDAVAAGFRPSKL